MRFDSGLALPGFFPWFPLPGARSSRGVDVMDDTMARITTDIMLIKRLINPSFIRASNQRTTRHERNCFVRR